MKPNKVYLCAGKGTAPESMPLLAFDRALSDCGVANFNHLRVSSVLPPRATILIDEKPPEDHGAIAYTVYAEKRTAVPSLISAALAIAIPINENHHGMIFEISGNMDAHAAEKQVSAMASMAMNDRHIKILNIITKSSTMFVQYGQSGCVLVTAFMVMGEGRST